MNLRLVEVDGDEGILEAIKGTPVEKEFTAVVEVMKRQRPMQEKMYEVFRLYRDATTAYLEWRRMEGEFAEWVKSAENPLNNLPMVKEREG